MPEGFDGIHVSAPDDFVGRQHELAQLVGVLERATSGHGRLVFLAGEPGAGKTRLALELTGRALAAGARVRWGTCRQGGGAPALWPWTQIVREHLRGADSTQLPQELTSGQQAVARLLDDMAAYAPTTPSSLPDDSEQLRFQLFAAVSDLFRAATAIDPLVLVLDDLQWADVPSLLLLRFIVQDVPDTRVVVVGIYRDADVEPTQPRARLLADLARDALVVDVDGLAPSDVHRLVASVIGTWPEHEVVTAIHRQSNGNPFFVRELARLVESSKPLGASGRYGVIERRLDQLSPGCRQLVMAAAVVGTEFSLELVQPLSGQSRERTLELLDEACAAQLIEPRAGRGDQFRFAHDLVRETLYAQLGEMLQVELHRRVGEVMEHLYGPEPGAHLPELAHHFLRGRIPEKGVAYGAQAGRRALDVAAYEEAAAHFARAVEVLEQDGQSDRRRLAGLLYDLAEAHKAAGNLPAARSIFQRAAGVAREVHAAELVTRAALGVGVEFTAGVVDHLEVNLLEEGLRQLGPADSPMRAQAEARLAKALLFAPAAERRAELASSAVAMGRRIGDPATLAAVLYDCHIGLWAMPAASERLAIASEVVELAERCGKRGLALQARGLRAGNLLELGDIRALQAEIAAFEASVRELRQVQLAWFVPFVRATIAALAGHFEDAQRQAEDGLLLGRRVQHQGVEVVYPTLLGMIRFAQGRTAELVGPLTELADRIPSIVWRAGLAYALCEAGRPDEGRLELERLAVRDIAELPRDFTWLSSLASLAMASTALQDRRLGAQVYDQLLPYAPFAVRATRIGVTCYGAAAHFLGLLAAMLGRLDAAANHFEVALDMQARLGAPAFLANTRFQYALVLRARGRPGDHERAIHLEREARDAARVLGIRLHLADMPVAASTITSQPAGTLTVREGEILRLIAGGQSNKEMANGLGLSVRTVERHITNLYAKIGARGKADATAYAFRNDLA